MSFTGGEIVAAISSIHHSKALGRDDLAPVMLKFLGENGVRYLTDQQLSRQTDDAWQEGV